MRMSRIFFSPLKFGKSFVTDTRRDAKIDAWGSHPPHKLAACSKRVRAWTRPESSYGFTNLRVMRFDSPIASSAARASASSLSVPP